VKKLPYSIHDTINSGQVFLWQNQENIWFGIDGQNTIQISHKPSQTVILSKKARNFLRDDDDFSKIVKGISKDKIVKKAIKHSPGLRITRQDPFQCYISFIASANSNIAKIRMCLEKLCRRFGTKIQFKNREFFLFPKPQILASATLEEVQQCGLGYRSSYIIDASRAVLSEKINFNFLKKTDYQTAKESLVKIPGIGNKVADCIMLYSLEKLEAFPLDVWMLKILEKYYSDKFDIDTNYIKKKNLYGTVDKINKKMGRDKVQILGQGIAKRWVLKRERLSPSYTTRWDELLKVHC